MSAEQPLWPISLKIDDDPFGEAHFNRDLANDEATANDEANASASERDLALTRLVLHPAKKNPRKRKQPSSGTRVKWTPDKTAAFMRLLRDCHRNREVISTKLAFLRPTYTKIAAALAERFSYLFSVEQISNKRDTESR